MLFLRRAQREGAVVDVSGAMPQSFVVTDFAGGRRVHHAAVHRRAQAPGGKGLRFSHAAPVCSRKKTAGKAVYFRPQRVCHTMLQSLLKKHITQQRPYRPAAPK